MSVRSPLHLLFSRLNRSSSLNSHIPWAPASRSLGGPPLASLQYANISLVLRGPKLDTPIWFEITQYVILKCQIEGKSHCSQSAGYTLAIQSGLMQPQIWLAFFAASAHCSKYVCMIPRSSGLSGLLQMYSLLSHKAVLLHCDFLILDRGFEPSALKQITAPKPSSPPNWPPYFSSYRAYFYTGFSHGEH